MLWVIIACYIILTGIALYALVKSGQDVTLSDFIGVIFIGGIIAIIWLITLIGSTSDNIIIFKGKK